MPIVTLRADVVQLAKSCTVDTGHDLVVKDPLKVSTIYKKRKGFLPTDVSGV